MFADVGVYDYPDQQAPKRYLGQGIKTSILFMAVIGHKCGKSRVPISGPALLPMVPI